LNSLLLAINILDHKKQTQINKRQKTTVNPWPVVRLIAHSAVEHVIDKYIVADVPKSVNKSHPVFNVDGIS
jgi:hypothetical protein